MDRFSAIVTRMDDAIWSMLLVALCLGVGLFLSLRMRFPQLRLLKEMGRVLKNGEEDGNGITPFQAFATTVGARVGMGNIAGVASAIFLWRSGRDLLDVDHCHYRRGICIYGIDAGAGI